MRDFDYTTLPQSLLAPEIVNLLTALHEHRGKQERYLEARADVLETLSEVARVQSADASNRIEGIFTSDKRLAEIMAETTEPRSRNEEEIAGYRDVMATIHENYPYIAPTPGVILQLHRDLYRYAGASFGGAWKEGDNAIVEYDQAGNRSLRFKPVPAVATPEAVANLCQAFEAAVMEGTYDPLLLMCLFVFDFTCIHPFNDGNGRMSRLLTLLLLYRCNYLVGRYVSLEKGIEATKQTYYEALRASSQGWGEGRNDYAPFVRYLLGIVLAAYSDFEDRVEGLSDGKMRKAKRIELLFTRKAGKVTKADILLECPDVSKTTVERVLHDLLEAGKIEKVGSGRATGYVRKER